MFSYGNLKKESLFKISLNDSKMMIYNNYRFTYIRYYYSVKKLDNPEKLLIKLFLSPMHKETM